VTNRSLKKPSVAWVEDFNDYSFYCKVRVPRDWMMEASVFKQRLRLWWWLTKLAWSLPK